MTGMNQPTLSEAKLLDCSDIRCERIFAGFFKVGLFQRAVVTAETDKVLMHREVLRALHGFLVLLAKA